ncbi:MAG: lipopolysaccharide transport periplasmic protein LptA [Pseudomonadota bacterium]
MKFLHLSLLLLLPLTLSAGPAATDTANKSTPVSIEADRMELDQAHGTSTYQGNVILIQGGLRLKAERITLYTVEKQLNRVVSEGKPTTMEQPKDDNRAPLHAEAEWIEYLPLQQTVQLKGKAQLRQNGNEFSGEHIRYDLKKQLVRASGNKQGDGRVRVLLQPANDEQKNDDHKMENKP